MGRRVVISGRVQGVGYRASCAARARQLGCSGWVRNLPDGRVEVVAGGDPSAVGALAEWCRHGPPAARVVSVQLSDAAEPAGPFEVR